MAGSEPTSEVRCGESGDRARDPQRAPGTLFGSVSSFSCASGGRHTGKDEALEGDVSSKPFEQPLQPWQRQVGALRLPLGSSADMVQR